MLWFRLNGFRPSSRKEHRDTHSGEFRTGVYRGLQQVARRRKIQRLHPVCRLVNATFHHLPLFILQWKEEYRRHAEHTLGNTNVCRAIFPYASLYERCEQHSRRIKGQGLLLSLLPWGGKQFDGISGLCQDKRFRRLFRTHGIQCRQTLWRRQRLRRPLGYMGRAVFAVFRHEDVRVPPAVCLRGVHCLVTPSLQGAGEVSERV